MTSPTGETGSFRVYIAASAHPSYARRVARAAELLREAGIVVISTWPETIAKVGNANPRDASREQRAGWAAQDLREIDAAHAVLFLVPGTDTPTRGAWLEIGYAHGAGKIVVFSGDTAQSVFCALGVEVETDVAAVEYLRELAETWRASERGYADHEAGRIVEWEMPPDGERFKP